MEKMALIVLNIVSTIIGDPRVCSGGVDRVRDIMWRGGSASLAGI